MIGWVFAGFYTTAGIIWAVKFPYNSLCFLGKIKGSLNSKKRWFQRLGSKMGAPFWGSHTTRLSLAVQSTALAPVTRAEVYQYQVSIQHFFLVISSLSVHGCVTGTSDFDTKFIISMCGIKFWKGNKNLRSVYKILFFEILSGFFHFWPFKFFKKIHCPF